MRVSGFYKPIGNDLATVKSNIENKFNNKTSPILDKIYGENFFQVTKIERAKEWDMKGYYKAFNVYFVLDIPKVNTIKGSELFCDLQEIVFSGLDIII